MALWQQGQPLYAPPVPVTKVLCTEQYVKRTEIFYHGETERLLTVGHPFYKVKEKNIPKVSSNQFRVFKIALPDPNAFALPDKSLHSPDKQRLVWGLAGIQVSRGQPLGGSVTGHPFLNVLADAENVIRPQRQGEVRKLTGMDVKQQQLLLVGCEPAIGEYWGKAINCVEETTPGDCPPIELKNKPIEDGDMMDIGWGAADFKELNLNKADVPLDLVNEKSLYPDYLKMAEEATGNTLFFYARKEQSYVRHIYARAGTEKEGLPEDYKFSGDELTNSSANYFGAPSGSLVSTEGQIFNRPYWLFQAQGNNNGICWNNNVFVTVGDNTRGGNLQISIGNTGEAPERYDTASINIFLRHVEEFKIALILELCIVPLTPETVSHLQTMNPTVLSNWEINVQPPPSSILEDTYRDTNNPAIKCTYAPAAPAPSKDIWSKFSFWNVDLKERLSLDLDQFQLGRRFLAQRGLGCTRKRKATGQRSSTTVTKRRKTSR